MIFLHPKPNSTPGILHSEAQNSIHSNGGYRCGLGSIDFFALKEWLAVGLALFASLCFESAYASEPAMRMIQHDSVLISQLKNGDFEQSKDNVPVGWQAAPQGCAIAANQGRSNSTAIICSNATEKVWSGISQTVVLNQTKLLPLSIRGWSKAQGVDGSPDSGYSLYVDILYKDGTPSWGHTANFRCGTHDWERREWVILPEKPIQSFTLHCLFRNHLGTVWFDDIEAGEVKSDGANVLFQGVPVQIAQSQQPGNNVPVKNYATRDGLTLGMQGGRVTSLRTDANEWAGPTPSGFLARDVAANSDVYGFDNGLCSELGLNIETEIVTNIDHIVIQGKVRDTKLVDRAVTLIFALPVDAAGSHWGDDMRRSRTIEGVADYVNLVNIDCGATGTMSLYPLGAIWNDRAGLALALDQAKPAQYRIGYHAGAKQLYLAYDFGLVRETDKFLSGAEFRFVLYRFHPREGFRSALQKYMEVFPEYFQVRSQRQGIWMPFTDIKTVQGSEDFGFRYHEGNNNVSWDDAHDVLSFRYTEPMTWWMAMDKTTPRTPAEAMKKRDEVARGGQKSSSAMAEVSRASAMQDEEGNPCLLFQDTPWCNGAVWSINPNPWLAVKPNGATIHWSPAIQEDLYGANAKGNLDGEYLDSLEGYVTANLNFRREHFRSTTVPLSFSRDSFRPALFKGLAVAEFTRWMADEVHHRKKLMFANGVPYRFTFLCPWLDIMGTETDWLSNGKYCPASDATMSLWRAMSGAKPYLLLMNTDFEAFGSAMMEKYFQRALFYGMWPSMFSHNAADNPYWQNPRWYNRDRPLFKKYIPLVRQVAEAGWHPVTEARIDNDQIHIERFGPNAEGKVYFTLLNDTEQSQTGNLTIELPLTPAANAIDLVSALSVPENPKGWQITLASQQTAVLEFKIKGATNK